jgi:cobalt/nickel transport system permease protein
MKTDFWIDLGRMDQLGRLDSPVHRRDPRVMILTTLAFIVVVMSFPRYQVTALAPLVLYPLSLMALGGIPAGYVLRRMLPAAPFAILVGVFNPLLDHRPVAALGSHAVTGGWMSFSSILVRFALTVAAALILIACTGINRLCAAAERLGLPRAFAAQLLFLYRYLFVVGDEGSRMLRSVELRSAGRRTLRPRVYGALVGHLLVRSLDRAERVYRAMAARGFDGQVRTLGRLRMRPADLAFALGWTAFFLAARLWNIPAHVGRALLRGQ